MHVHYRPADHVLDHLSQVDFVGIVGPTGSGKTTLARAAAAHDPRVHRVLNVTSRAPRSDETDGVDHHFVPKEVMEERIQRGEYVQVAPTLLGNLYATAPEDYTAEGVATMEILAATVPMFRGLPFKSVRIVYSVPPNWDVWQEQIASHHFPPEQLQKRIQEARQSLQFALHDEHLSFVVNDDVPTAVEDFTTLIFETSLPERLKADQTRARTIVRDLLDRLDA